MERTLRLLIVDDEEVVRDVLRLKLENRTDITLTEASSVEEALAKFSDETFDLVLLDLRLQFGTEGLDILAEIKNHRPQTEVIMFSAYGTIPIAVEAMRRGAIDFISKEKDYEDLVILKLNEFIRKKSLIADRELLIQTKYQVILMQTDSNVKGKALEELIAALFASIDGFIEIDRNVKTETEEIDVVFRNESLNPLWQKESSLILIECKNWHSQKVGKNEFVLFKEKMENRVGRCRLGFLICTKTFAETVTKEMLRSSKGDLLIVPIDGEKLRALIESKDRNRLLRDFVDKAALV